MHGSEERPVACARAACAGSRMRPRFRQSTMRSSTSTISRGTRDTRERVTDDDRRCDAYADRRRHPTSQRQRMSSRLRTRPMRIAGNGLRSVMSAVNRTRTRPTGSTRVGRRVDVRDGDGSLVARWSVSRRDVPHRVALVLRSRRPVGTGQRSTAREVESQQDCNHPANAGRSIAPVSSMLHRALRSVAFAGRRDLPLDDIVATDDGRWTARKRHRRLSDMKGANRNALTRVAKSTSGSSS